MTKKKASLTVDTDINGIFTTGKRTPITKPKPQGISMEQALGNVLRQMEATGLRERTLLDYRRHVSHFVKSSDITYLTEVTADHLYDWLSSMDVNNQTKLTRLKCVKAFLSRCFDNGWLTSKTWRHVQIKADSPAKKGAADNDVQTLLTLLDLNDFVQLRDATAILTMYQTGIRVGTITQITEDHIDFEAGVFRIPGAVVKNHEELLLPFDDILAHLLTILLRQNALVRADNGARNSLVFITKQGGTCQSHPTNNIIGKRITKYSKEFGLSNITPHSLRRAFAMNLRKKGAHISLISKALGHSDLSVTSRYLRLDKEEVADSLRDYL